MTEELIIIAQEAAIHAQIHVRVNTGVLVEFDWHVLSEKANNIELAFECLCRCLEIDAEELKKKSRKGDLVLYRQVIVGILKTQYPKVKYRELAKLIGQDHTSTIYHFRECNNRLKYNDQPFSAVYSETETHFKNWLKKWASFT